MDKLTPVTTESEICTIPLPFTDSCLANVKIEQEVDVICAKDQFKYGIIFSLIALAGILLLTKGGRRLIKFRR